MTDVDDVADADLVARLAPTTRFAEAWRGRPGGGRVVIEQSFSEVFASALDGAPTVVVGLGDEPLASPCTSGAGRPTRPTTSWSRCATGRPSTSAAVRAG